MVAGFNIYLGEWSFSRLGHLDKVTCHAPLTWVGSLVGSILGIELKLTECLVIVDTILPVNVIYEYTILFSLLNV